MNSITIYESAFDRTISLYKGKLKNVYLNASEIILKDVTSEDAMKAGEISFHVPTANAKTALTEYGIADANVIVEKAPLRRNVDQDQVGDATLFFLSELSRGVTGEVLHVDSGFHIIGG